MCLVAASRAGSRGRLMEKQLRMFQPCGHPGGGGCQGGKQARGAAAVACHEPRPDAVEEVSGVTRNVGGPVGEDHARAAGLGRRPLEQIGPSSQPNQLRDGVAGERGEIDEPQVHEEDGDKQPASPEGPDRYRSRRNHKCHHQVERRSHKAECLHERRSHKAFECLQ